MRQRPFQRRCTGVAVLLLRAPPRLTVQTTHIPALSLVEARQPVLYNLSPAGQSAMQYLHLVAFHCCTFWFSLLYRTVIIKRAGRFLMVSNYQQGKDVNNFYLFVLVLVSNRPKVFQIHIYCNFIIEKNGSFKFYCILRFKRFLQLKI